MSDRDEIVANVRRLSGVPADRGPDDLQIKAGVVGFVEAFEYWYIRVMREAVPKYRNLIIKRINPFIRKIELEGESSSQAAHKLVEDYNSRNFVTAGGWALEEMAVGASQLCQKSTAEGMDMQRFDPSTGDYHLYVLKSGLVTRNSDILNALKRNARKAERLLLQGRATGTVRANYVIMAGKTASSFEDGINRPSSGEFWSQVLELGEDEAIELALAMAAEAGRIVRKDASNHINALVTLVSAYIADRADPTVVDWDYITIRNMRSPEVWKAEDKERHTEALTALAATGYEVGASEGGAIDEVVARVEGGGEDEGDEAAEE